MHLAPPPEMMPGHRAVYTASPYGAEGQGTWREMSRELWTSRELTWRLFLRDFSARYRQSALGYLWAVFPPLLTTAVFVYLARSRTLPIPGTAIPYPVFALLNITVWLLFVNGLTSTTQSLTSAGSFLTKINFPRETLVIAAFGQSVFEFLIRAGLVAAAFALYRVPPAWTVLLIPLALLPLCLLTLGLGFLLSLIQGVARDIGQILPMLLMFWMFLTPVVYPVPAHGATILLTVLNPVSPFLIAVQDLATHGSLSHGTLYASGCIVSLVVFLLGWRVFHLSETRIAERL